MGLASFSHNFGTLSGQKSGVATIFDSIGSKPSLLDTFLFMVSLITPAFDGILTGRRVLLEQLSKTLRGLAEDFLAASGDVTTDNTSVMGLLGGRKNESNFSLALILLLWSEICWY